MSDEPPKQKNVARNISRAFPKLIGKVSGHLVGEGDMGSLVIDLRNEILGFNIPVEQRLDQLFSFGPWDDLHLATLNDRHMPLPHARLPKSEAELQALCSNLLDRTGDDGLRMMFVKGWPDGEVPEHAFRTFCGRLWGTSRHDPEFFVAVVQGNHRSALSYLAQKGTVKGLSRNDAIGLICRMALIWCAHDVQATTARARLVQTRSFGWLMVGTEKRMMASTVFAVWRDDFEVLDDAINGYRTNAEARAGKPEQDHEDYCKRDDDIETIVARAPQNRLDLNMLPRADRDARIKEIRDYIAEADDPFWQELKKPSKQFKDTSLSKVWYSGLTPSEMTLVAVIRLIHLETVLESCLLSSNTSTSGPEDFTVPVYDETQLKYGWKGRSKRLTEKLNNVILRGSDEKERKSGSKDYRRIKNAVTFIADALSEPLPTHSSDLKGRRKTLSDLNVAAIARLQR